MKKILCMIWFFITLLCTACSSPGNFGSLSKEDSYIMETMTIEFIQLVPDKELTHDDLVKGVSDLCSAAQDSYSRMAEASQNENAPRKGIRAANKVKKTYEERLKELSSMDYYPMTDEEILNYSAELSEIISAIRKARDLLNGI